MAELKASVLSGLKWSSGAKLATQLINWAITIIVIRILLPEDYGLMAMAALIISFCILLNEMGLGAAIIQTKDLNERLLKQAFGLILLINAALLVILLTLSGPISNIFNEPRLTTIIQVLALQFPIQTLFVIPNSLLTRDMNFKAISIVGVISEICAGICTFAMAWSGYGVWSLIIGSLVRALVQTVGINIAKPFLVWPTFNLKGFSKTAKFGGHVSLQGILWYFYSQSDIFIIGKMLGKTTLGYYSVAMHIATLPLQKIANILNQIALPAFSKIQGNPALVRKYTLKSIRILGLFAFPAFWGISSIAPELTQVFLGDKWLLAIVPVQLLTLTVPLRTISLSLIPTINGIGRPDMNTKIFVAACIIMPTAFLIGVRWGLLGVCYSWIISYSLWYVYMLKQLLPIIGLSMKSFLLSIIKPAIISVTMYSVIYFTRIVMETLPVSNWITLIILILIGGITYTGGIYIFCNNEFKEVIGLIKGNKNISEFKDKPNDD